MRQLQASEGGLDRSDQPFAAQGAQAGRVVTYRGEAATVIPFPLCAFFGLEPVVLADAHKATVGHQAVEQLWYPLTQPRPIIGEVFHEQVGQERRRRSQSCLPAYSARRNLGNEKNKGADTGSEFPVLASGTKSANELVNLLEHNPALEHVRRLFLVKEVGAHDVADRLAGDMGR